MELDTCSGLKIKETITFNDFIIKAVSNLSCINYIHLFFLFQYSISLLYHHFKTFLIFVSLLENAPVMFRNIVLVGVFLFALPFLAKAEYERFSPMGNSHVFFLQDGDDSTFKQYPFIGGLVSPALGVLDINRNDSNDLVLVDRWDQNVMTFIYEGNRDGIPFFRYQPEYEDKIPLVHDFVTTRDFNNNGNQDIFTARPRELGTGMSVYENVSEDGTLKFEKAADPITGDFNFRRGNIPGIADVTGNDTIDLLSYRFMDGSVRLFEKDPEQEDAFSYQLTHDCWGFFRETTGDTGNVELGYTTTWDDDCPPPQRGKRHSGASTLLMDIDQTGDKDAIIADADLETVYLVKNGKFIREEGEVVQNHPRDSMIEARGSFPQNHPIEIENRPGVYKGDLNLNGRKDLIAAPSDLGPVQSVDQIWLYTNKNTEHQEAFEFQKENFLQNEMVDEGVKTIPRLLDVNNNGLKDLLMVVQRDADPMGMEYPNPFFVLYENKGDSLTPVFQKKEEDFLGFAGDTPENFNPAFGDLTGNDKPDMIAGNAFGELDVYFNTGKEDSFAYDMATDDTIPPLIENYRDEAGYNAPYLHDITNNGHKDLFVGNWKGFITYLANQGGNEDFPFEFEHITDTFGGIRVADTFRQGGQTHFHDGMSSPAFADLNESGKAKF